MHYTIYMHTVGRTVVKTNDVLRQRKNGELELNGGEPYDDENKRKLSMRRK